MQAAGIVEALDVLKQIAPCVGAGGVNPVMNPLDFEGVEEALHRGIVETSAFADHRWRVPALAWNLPISFGGVLDAAVGMMDQPGAGRWRWMAIMSASKAISVWQRLAHRPTNDFARMQVQDAARYSQPSPVGM